MNVNKVMWKQIKQICLVDEGYNITLFSKGKESS